MNTNVEIPICTNKICAQLCVKFGYYDYLMLLRTHRRLCRSRVNRDYKFKKMLFVNQRITLAEPIWLFLGLLTQSVKMGP